MQIKLIHNPEGDQEWMGIEMHGTIAPQEGSFDRKTLGTLCWGDNNNVYMVIGNQTLEGKVSKTDRPLLVIQKTECGDDGEKNAVVRAVIRKKIVFKARPRPLVISTVG
ncbi:hypothetical protein CAEBREN_01043 [Caenorhabditis brenneri]|uniref:Uncharacterized protein n=1 Tax=Caenorhabditis brenneri TaxID=135651 RepID=G0MFH3_CAEBE|nr:hypothetical protein CAEBREN_22138 [Caenorhabditis brenneri]EGT54430.1 hypothetical protein CAEBREN_01043 [Caenorhabditis brenneri]